MKKARRKRVARAENQQQARPQPTGSLDRQTAVPRLVKNALFLLGSVGAFGFAFWLLSWGWSFLFLHPRPLWMTSQGAEQRWMNLLWFWGGASVVSGLLAGSYTALDQDDSLRLPLRLLLAGMRMLSAAALTFGGLTVLALIPVLLFVLPAQVLTTSLLRNVALVLFLLWIVLLVWIALLVFGLPVLGRGRRTIVSPSKGKQVSRKGSR